MQLLTFGAEVQDKEQRATGRSSGVQPCSNIEYPFSRRLARCVESHAKEEKGESVHSKRDRDHVEGLDPTEKCPPKESSRNVDSGDHIKFFRRLSVFACEDCDLVGVRRYDLTLGWSALLW